VEAEPKKNWEKIKHKKNLGLFFQMFFCFHHSKSPICNHHLEKYVFFPTTLNANLREWQRKSFKPIEARLVKMILRVLLGEDVLEGGWIPKLMLFSSQTLAVTTYPPFPFKKPFHGDVFFLQETNQPACQHWKGCFRWTIVLKFIQI